MTRILVAYDSRHGSTWALADEIVSGAGAAGAEVRLRRCSTDSAWSPNEARGSELLDASDDLLWADGIAIGAPVRFGAVSVEMRAEIESWALLWKTHALDGKAFTAFTSSNSVQGGSQLAILGLYATFCHFGGVIVPTGYAHEAAVDAGGNPYGTSISTAQSRLIPDPVREVARHQGERLTRVAKALHNERRLR